MNNGRSALLISAVLSTMILMACAQDSDQRAVDSINMEAASIIGSGAVSTEAREFAATLTPDGDALYFNRVSEDGAIRIWRSKRNGNKWAPAQLFSHTDDRYNDIDPFISRSGDRLYFTSDRPLPGAAFDADAADLWYSPRLSKGYWGPPVHAGPNVNGPDSEVFVSEDANGVLYFAVFGERPVEGPAPVEIRTAKRNGDAFTVAEAIDIPRPAGMRLTNPAVAPEGDYIVFAGRADGDEPDLVVSRKMADGSWSSAQPLQGSINTADFAEFAPFVHNNGERIIFTSDRRQGADGEANWDLYEADLQFDD